MISGQASRNFKILTSKFDGGSADGDCAVPHLLLIVRQGVFPSGALAKNNTLVVRVLDAGVLLVVGEPPCNLTVHMVEICSLRR